MRIKLPALLLVLFFQGLMVQTAYSTHYCPFCNRWVTPTPERLCPSCSNSISIPALIGSASGASGIATDFLLAMQLQKQQWEGLRLSPAYIGQQLQSIPRVSCEIPAAGNHHEVAIRHIYAQLATLFRDEEITHRNNDMLKSSVCRCLHIAGKFRVSDGKQETLDQIVRKNDFIPVPVNDACFGAQTTGDLVQHMFPEVQHGHHEYLLIFFEPVTGGEAQYHFISLVASDHGVSIVMPTVAQESFFTVPTFIDGHLSIILLVLFSQFKADEYYVYHRSPQ